MKNNNINENSDLFSSGLSRTFTKVIIHIIFWVVFFSLPFLFRPDMGPRPDNNVHFHIPTPIILNNIFLIIAFYANLFVFMPLFFNKKKWGLYVLFTCMFLFFSFMIHYVSKEIDIMLGRDFINNIPHHRYHQRPRGFEFRQFSFIYSFIMIWALSMVYHLVFQLQKSKKHADMVYASALQSELSFLKAQINPHFLFNTLNNIYSLTLKKSDMAPIAVMKLSNLMRQITSDTGEDYVPFEEEEKFIVDYVELQKLRLTEKTKIDLDISKNYDHLKIAPRLLIPFIENAFKYGVSNRFESDIIIRINFENDNMIFFIRNTIHSASTDSMEKSSGIGIENTKRRLDLLYEGRYDLKIDDASDSFTVTLKIKLL
jgi:hypothetical protein